MQGPCTTLTPAVVTARGEIDLVTGPALRRSLTAALRDNPLVVLDMSEVTFMDCAGLSALVAARNLAERTGSRFVLRSPGQPVTRVLRLTGLSRHLTIEP